MKQAKVSELKNNLSQYVSSRISQMIAPEPPTRDSTMCRKGLTSLEERRMDEVTGEAPTSLRQ
jgi:hypothetical protein